MTKDEKRKLLDDSWPKPKKGETEKVLKLIDKASKLRIFRMEDDIKKEAL